MRILLSLLRITPSSASMFLRRSRSGLSPAITNRTQRALVRPEIPIRNFENVIANRLNRSLFTRTQRDLHHFRDDSIAESSSVQPRQLGLEPSPSIYHILKQRKKQLVQRLGRMQIVDGRLQGQLPIADDYIARTVRRGDLAVQRPKRRLSPYFGRNGLLNDVGQNEEATFITDLRTGIRTGNFTNESAKELHAITLAEGMRSQSALKDFARVLNVSKSDREFIDGFRHLHYTGRGGAMRQRFHRMERADEYSDTDDDEAEILNPIYTAKARQYEAAKREFGR